MRSFATLLLLLPMLAHGQSLVSTSPMPRTALLEEFTAIRCGNCPAAHVVANGLGAQYGQDLTTIAIHGGSLAVPQAGQPDFRTTEGAALWSQFGVNFQPQGMVNRQGLGSASSWNGAIQGVLTGTSPVNIGVSSTYDAGSMTLLVEVELYYTGTSPAGDDAIHVALTEDHIIGWQTDYGNGNQPNYDHRHVLRDLMTPVSGDVVTTTGMGTLVQRSYSIPIDPSWNLTNMSTVAFVGDANGQVHQVQEVDSNGGLTTGIQVPEQAVLGDPYPQPATDVVNFPIQRLAASSMFSLRDATGRVVAQRNVPANTTLFTLSVSEYPEGVYFGSFATGDPVKRMVVVR